MADASPPIVELVARATARTAVDNETYFCNVDSVAGYGDFGYSLGRRFEKALDQFDALNRAAVGGAAGARRSAVHICLTESLALNLRRERSRWDGVTSANMALRWKWRGIRRSLFDLTTKLTSCLALPPNPPCASPDRQRRAARRLSADRALRRRRVGRACPNYGSLRGWFLSDQDSGLRRFARP